jgi:HEAT repeat protein
VGRIRPRDGSYFNIDPETGEVTSAPGSTLTPEELAAVQAWLREAEAAVIAMTDRANDPGDPYRPELSYAERAARLARLLEAPDPAAAPWLAGVLRDPDDPLSPTAAVALGRTGGLPAARALLIALDDPRPVVRQEAIRGLARTGAAVGETYARRLLRSDPDAPVRVAAAEALAILGARGAAPLLRARLREETPPAALRMARALVLLGDPEGMHHLRRAAFRDDPALSPSAIVILAELNAPSAVSAILQGLRSPEHQVRLVSRRILESVDPERLERLLRAVPGEDREAVRLQLGLWQCAEGEAPLPEGTDRVVMGGQREDRILALRCCERAGRIREYPAVVTALRDPSPAVRERARHALEAMLARHGIEGAPGIRASVDSWRNWWIGLHGLAAVAPGRAILVLPDGRRAEVREGDRLPWGGVIRRVRPGAGGEGLEGAAVEVEAGGRAYRITARAATRP